MPDRTNERQVGKLRITSGTPLGWNVLPGADTWSAKEYKGYVYTGDMARGFDVFRLAPCADDECEKTGKK